MKILIATTSLPPGGGIGAYVHALSKWMNISGHEVLVCRSSPVQHGNTDSYPYSVRDFPVPKERKLEGKVIFNLYKAIEDFSPKAIINNDNIYISNLLPYLSPDIVKVGVVHGYRRIGLSWDDHLIIFNAALVNYQHLDYLVAISTPMKEAILGKIPNSSDRVRIVHNGLFRDHSQAGKPRDANEPIGIVFGGGRNRTKGADLMLCASIKMAHARIKSYQIFWLGNLRNRGKLSKRFLERIPHVTPMGYVPNDRVQEILGQASILVMPSRAEGCPMMLLEAMAKGMVSVVSDCPSAMKEIVCAANAGLVVSTGSWKQLLSALLEIVNSDHKRELMARKAIGYFDGNLTMEYCGRQIEALCNEPRPGRNTARREFPPRFFVPYHRRPYRDGSPLHPLSLMQRIRYILGWLPRKRHIDAAIFKDSLRA